MFVIELLFLFLCAAQFLWSVCQEPFFLFFIPNQSTFLHKNMKDIFIAVY